jgi:hypothetical protein
MPKALAPDKRERILADIRAGGKSRNQIARDHQVSVGSVTNLSRTVSDHAFDRSATKKATEAAVADSAALRAATSRRFLVKANELLDQMDEPFLAFSFGGRENSYNEHQFGKPTVDALRTMMTTAAIAFDKHMAQEKHDSSGIDGVSSVDSWLAAMVDGEGH